MSDSTTLSLNWRSRSISSALPLQLAVEPRVLERRRRLAGDRAEQRHVLAVERLAVRRGGPAASTAIVASFATHGTKLYRPASRQAAASSPEQAAHRQRIVDDDRLAVDAAARRASSPASIAGATPPANPSDATATNRPRLGARIGQEAAPSDRRRASRRRARRAASSAGSRSRSLFRSRAKLISARR